MCSPLRATEGGPSRDADRLLVHGRQEQDRLILILMSTIRELGKVNRELISRIIKVQDAHIEEHNSILRLQRRVAELERENRYFKSMLVEVLESTRSLKMMVSKILSG